MLESLSPTKQSASARGHSVYRYYAGYSRSFMVSLMDHLGVEAGSTVMDPWNGAGTTTEVCAFRGVRSIGIDVNPFMRVVAALRGTQTATVMQDLDRVEDALLGVEVSTTGVLPQVAAANLMRGIADGGAIGDDSIVALFALACATRSILLSVRTKNPTWFSLRRAPNILSNEEEVRAAALLELQRLRIWARTMSCEGEYQAPILLTGDASTMPVDHQVDHIVSSPPYLTRIDYVQKTLPELLFLSEFHGLDIQELRRSMLGSVLTSGYVEGDCSLLSPGAISAISKIRGHSSKASGTYYVRFFSAYFEGLEKTLRLRTAQLSEGGTVTLVTQGSYYKEIYIDLPKIVSEMMELLGYQEFERAGFRSANHMATINTRTFASKQQAPEEVVSSFRRKL